MTQKLAKQDAWLAIVVSTLVLGVGISAWCAYSATAVVADAQTRLDECLRLAGQITALRDAPDKVEQETRGHDELAKQVERWSLSSGIKAAAIQSISPLAPRRVAESDYQEVGAEIDLTGVTLAQLAQLAERIAAADDRLMLSDLRLQSPREAATDGGATEQWNAELALTYLLYSPKSTRR